jgi:hypothetical protein
VAVAVLLGVAPTDKEAEGDMVGTVSGDEDSTGDETDEDGDAPSERDGVADTSGSVVGPDELASRLGVVLGDAPTDKDDVGDAVIAPLLGLAPTGAGDSSPDWDGIVEELGAPGSPLTDTEPGRGTDDDEGDAPTDKDAVCDMVIALVDAPGDTDG